jgi:hypothetical protein
VSRAFVVASGAFFVVSGEDLDVGDDFVAAAVARVFGEVGFELAGRGEV